MPLSGKAKIEVYLPDSPNPAYQELLTALVQEFTHTFGGCTTNHGLDGNYLARVGQTMHDRIVTYLNTISLSGTGDLTRAQQAVQLVVTSAEFSVQK